ncbi:MAG: hypothetical protein PHQ78_00845 [Candidatus Cloacimonetes bacterium]|jgi:hypothetical protein|nr:hypothetical protein [Candidatus Cloacimonadota bacterium]MDD2505852.1 hypothetical protein [Candidatus Cloacimonadota bacterium]MDD4559481.1 hypothetical protein [Candidatus Cloacimonadota bacterium]
MKKFCLILLVIVLSQAAFAQNQVRYAGFSFSGDYANIPQRYKYTHQLFAQKDSSGLSVLEQEFFRMFEQNKVFGNFELVFTNIDTRLAMTITLLRENVDFEQIGEYVKLIYNLGFSLNILDYDEMRVIQSYPVKVAYLDIIEGSEDDILQTRIINTIHEIIQKQVINGLSRRVAEVYLAQSGTLSMKVSDITFSDDVLHQITDSGQNEASYAALIANQATEALAFDLNVSMLPYSRDYAGQKMALSFSDAEMQNFSIPAASYDLAIHVDKFYKALHSEKNTERVYVYGAYTNVKIYDAELGDVYWNNEVKHGAAKLTVKNQVVDDFANFNEVLLTAVTKTMIDTFKADKELMRDKKGKKGVIKRCQNF